MSATTTVYFFSWSREDSIFRRLSGDTLDMIWRDRTFLYTEDTWEQEDCQRRERAQEKQEVLTTGNADEP